MVALALLITLFPGAVTYAAELSVPNGNFENTVASNGELKDGWTYRLYVNPSDALTDGMLYYAINSEQGNGISSSGSGSLVMKCPGTSGGYNKTAIILESPVIAISNPDEKELTFTYTFDYKCIAANMNTAMLFTDKDGKVYNGSEWIEFNVTKDDDWRLTDANGKPCYYTVTTSGTNKNLWKTDSVTADAPSGTCGVKLIVIATGGGANKFAVDNLRISYSEKQELLPVPSPVTDLNAISDDGRVILSWRLPSDMNYYGGIRIIAKSESEADKTIYVNGTEITSVSFGELTNGVEYTFEVCSTDENKEYFSDPVTVVSVPLVPGSFAPLGIKNLLSGATVYTDDYEYYKDINILPLEGEAITDEIRTFADAINLFNISNAEIEFSSDTPGVSFRTVLYDVSGSLRIRKQQLVYKPAGNAGDEINIKILGKTGIYKGEAEMTITLAAPPAEEKPAENPDADIRQLYVPNGGFERWQGGIEPTDYNMPLSGGFRTVLFGKENGRLGNDQLCYRATSGATGKGLDIKVPSTNFSGYMLVLSPFIPTPDAASREYTLTYMYKQNAVRNTAAMYFYNENQELFSGYDGDGNPIWIANPDGNDMWSSLDAKGNKCYEPMSAQSVFSKGELKRTSPEGTAYIAFSFNAYGNSAYRIYVDEASLSYEKTPKVKPVTELSLESGDRSVILRWNKTPGDDLYYGAKITVKKENEVFKIIETTEENQQSITIDGLTNNEKYIFLVSSFDKSRENYAAEVTVSGIPHLPGILPVKNKPEDKTIFSDDAELSIDLNIINDGGIITDDVLLAHYNMRVDGINVFEAENKSLSFSSDNPQVTFRSVDYNFAVTADGSKVQKVIKQQLVYKPLAGETGKKEIKVTADDGNGASGSVTFTVEVIAPPSEERPQDDPSLEYKFLYIPNSDFDRTAPGEEYNRDLHGGWSHLLWGTKGCLGDNQLCYRITDTNDGKGIDLKAPSGGSTNLMIISPMIETDSAEEREYIFSLVYKMTASDKQNFAMFFYNGQGEVFMGYENENPVWKAAPTGADLWASKDAFGKEAYEVVPSASGYTPIEIKRTAPEGTEFIRIALAATGSSAYRYQADALKLRYLKNEAPVINAENPLQATVALGNEYSLKLNDVFSDPEGKELTFTAESDMVKISDGMLSVKPAVLGENNFTVIASDIHGAKAELTLSLNVVTAAFVSLANGQIEKSEGISASLKAADSSGNPVTSPSDIGADGILRIGISFRNTADKALAASVILTEYSNDGIAERITVKSLFVPSTEGDTTYEAQKDFHIENKHGYVTVNVWSSPAGLDSLAEPLMIKE